MTAKNLMSWQKLASLVCCFLVLTMVVQAAEQGRGAARQSVLEKLRTRRQKEPAAATSTNGTLSLKHAGQTRTYRLHRPTKGTAQPVPLVFVLHGFLADGAMTEAMSGFNRVADKHSFAVIYPDGIGRMWRFWENLDGKIAAGSTDDVGFIAALIDQLVKDKIADPRRVYVTGISNGGYMSNRLGYSLADKIAAIAPVAGSIPKNMSESAKPPRVMPVMTIHGTDDRIVKPDGTDAITNLDLSLSAVELVEWWAKSNACAAKPKSEQVPDRADDGTQVWRHAYADSKGKELVVHYEIKGGGHTWPGGSFMPELVLGKTSRDINASESIWEFFRLHTLPEK